MSNKTKKFDQDFIDYMMKKYGNKGTKRDQLLLRYELALDDDIVLNWMPPEDYARLEEIVEECIATGKPYDNYMPVPDDENILIDY